MTAIRIYLDGTFEATAAKAVDDGLADVRAAVREQGLSPNSPRGQALMEKLMHEMPKRRSGQPPVTVDVAALQKQRTGQAQVVKMLKQEIAKMSEKNLLGTASLQKLEDLRKQLDYEERKYKGLELSIRRLQKRQSK